MIASETLLSADLESLYAGCPGDTSFADVMERFSIDDDADLADLIEIDGRMRLRLGRPVTLDRYLAAVPDLPARPAPLDAAIDMALRWLSKTSTVTETAVAELSARFPELGQAIREAVALNDALWTTTRVRRQLRGSLLTELPCQFGPRLEDGRQRYEIRELLGEGAVGAVYLAVDRVLSEDDHEALVSIKLLASLHRSRWTRHQLVEEATKARRISHPNVARVLDRGVSEDGRDYVVYEFVAGGDLSRWVKKRRSGVPIEVAARLMAKVARGVHAAHMAGLVHNDLSPKNIVVTTEGEPKVTDFGIAVRQSETETISYADGVAPLGNLAFMSPEQYRREPGALTIPGDIYAIGGILYWLLTGALPNGATPQQVRCTHDVVNGRKHAPSIREHRPEVNRDLELICSRAMAEAPEARHGSASELADDLEAWLRREPIAWTRPSLYRRMWLWSRRKPAVVGSLACSVIILLAAAVAVSRFAIETAVAVDRAKRVQQARQNSADELRIWKSYLRDAQAAGIGEQILPHLWVTEWLLGPVTLADSPDRLDLWEIRVAVVRNLLSRARSQGRDGQFNALIWESALGYWLTEMGHYDEAAPLTKDNHDKWAALLHPEDRWLVHLRGLHACAVVGRLANDDAYRRIAPQSVSALATTLEEAERSLFDEAPWSPLHNLVRKSMRLMETSGLLDAVPDSRE